MDTDNKDNREAGILLHPTSLPGKYGIGEIGPEAYDFIDFLKQAKIRLWQVLPLGPTGFGDSPYSSFSSSAGNPMLISIGLLINDGYLTKSELLNRPHFKKGVVEYGKIIPWKTKILGIAAKRFKSSAKDTSLYLDFCKKNSHWLEDYSLFISIKHYYETKLKEDGKVATSWNKTWDRDIALYKRSEIKKYKRMLVDEIECEKIIQYFFYSQWKKLKEYANKNNIKIIGDIPIYVAEDSVDVWSNRKYFLLDRDGQPTHVAGVPPDYFSEDGQRWGNPLYNWKRLSRSNFKWWISRLNGVLELVDIVKIDHFRGFEAYWSVKASEDTAKNGKWIKAPGDEFFKTIKRKLGDIPIIVENLGVITPEVDRLMNNFSLPGMHLIQYGFFIDKSDHVDNSCHIPYNHVKNSVAYTGTHDNSTLLGWLKKCSKKEIKYIRDYYNYRGRRLNWVLIRSLFESHANMAILPMQDILELDDRAIMNIPSTTGGNWAWQLTGREDYTKLAKKIKKLVELYGR